MRATAPSGAAEFEGIVAWAGELGYGVRDAERGQYAVAEPVGQHHGDDLEGHDVDGHDPDGHGGHH
jgi:NADH-quinone oxidoreductase subunit I